MPDQIDFYLHRSSKRYPGNVYLTAGVAVFVDIVVVVVLV